MQLVSACVVLLSVACLVQAIPIVDLQHTQLHATSRCMLPQAAAVVCPKESSICKCPIGFYGNLTHSTSSREWRGLCRPCPKGFWSSAVGATSIGECSEVACPQRAINHPLCECEPDTSGSVEWMVCTGRYEGTCTDPDSKPASNPPHTTILIAPPETVSYASVVVFFRGNSSADDNGMSLRYSCLLDGVDVPCSAPSVSLEKLPQGPHTFSVWAVDQDGQVDPNPPTITFEVNVPCPAHSRRSDDSDKCECFDGHYSPSGVLIDYVEGVYVGSCEFCGTCGAGEFLVGCNATSKGTCVGCSPGTYKIWGAEASMWNTTCSHCQPCEAGEWRTECGGSSAGECVACAHGTYKSSTGEWDTLCTPCAACEAGSERTSCGPSSEGICRKCDEGMFKEDDETGPWDSACVPCKPCDAGYYRTMCGGVTQGSCAACDAGKFKAVGGEGSDWNAVCEICTPCQEGMGGYRAHCGGPEGPGTCEVCAECVGARVQECFCDVVV